MITRHEWRRRPSISAGHDHQMVDGCDAQIDHSSRMLKRTIKIRNRKAAVRLTTTEDHEKCGRSCTCHGRRQRPAWPHDYPAVARSCARLDKPYRRVRPRYGPADDRAIVAVSAEIVHIAPEPDEDDSSTTPIDGIALRAIPRSSKTAVFVSPPCWVTRGRHLTLMAPVVNASSVALLDHT